jgi:hypothetical protein
MKISKSSFEIKVKNEKNWEIYIFILSMDYRFSSLIYFYFRSIDNGNEKMEKILF